MSSIMDKLDAKQARRMRQESRHLDQLDRREAIAERMIGELSTGRFYVYPVGGKYREGTRADLVQFLLRNKYA
jgi:hypothetical protein